MRLYFGVKWILADLLKTVLLGSTPVEKWGKERIQRFATDGKDKREPAGRPYRTSRRYKEKRGANPEICQYGGKERGRTEVLPLHTDKKAKDGEDTGLKNRHYNKSKTSP